VVAIRRKGVIGQLSGVMEVKERSDRQEKGHEGQDQDGAPQDGEPAAARAAAARIRWTMSWSVHEWPG